MTLGAGWNTIRFNLCPVDLYRPSYFSHSAFHSGKRQRFDSLSAVQCICIYCQIADGRHIVSCKQLCSRCGMYPALNGLLTGILCGTEIWKWICGAAAWQQICYFEHDDNIFISCFKIDKYHLVYFEVSSPVTLNKANLRTVFHEVHDWWKANPINICCSKLSYHMYSDALVILKSN